MISRGGLSSQYFYPVASAILLSVIVVATTSMTLDHSSISNEDLVLPGTPVESTVFSVIISDSLDPCAFNGTWTPVSDKPYMMNMTLPENSVSVDQAHQICRDFFGTNLSASLSLNDTLTPVDNETHLWGFKFSYPSNSSAFTAHVWVNAITGRVCAYQEYALSPAWLEDQNLLGSSSYNTSSDSDRADSIALDFLRLHDYTVLAGSRHVRTHRVEYESERMLYEIELATPVQGVFMSRYLSGVILTVDLSLSRVISLSYEYVHLPAIDLSNAGLCSPEAARVSASILLGPGKIEWKNTCLRMVPKTPLFRDRTQFQLAWGFEFLHPNGEIGEIQTDAITGQYSDLYTGIVGNEENQSLGVLLFSASCIGFSFAVGFASYLLVLTYRKSRS